MAGLWGCKNLDSEAAVERALREAIDACGVTLRQLVVHPWEPYNGVTAFAIIAESHISVHTWPEMGYAAVDVFTCGEEADPDAAVPVFQRHFEPERLEVTRVDRGVILD
jgi:S-adenosylmethionine decarboxylase